MSPRRGLLTLLIGPGLAVAACTPQELSDMFDVVELRATENPIEVAARHSAEMLE